MLLGKRPRPRPPMKRTTSMTGIRGPDLADELDQEPSSAAVVHDHHNYSPLISTTNYSRSVQSAAPDHFLRTCGLCKRRLAPTGRDIFMYRGDTAFCSWECREKQIKEDEKTTPPSKQNGTTP